ncbi:hypothetical protein [Megalodesulfovibrio paquesii]
MARLSTLKRDDATGVFLHRVGSRWLPLEQALEEQAARDEARQPDQPTARTPPPGAVAPDATEARTHGSGTGEKA